MYNIKVNGNYNVLINDIKIYVSPNHEHGVDIDEETYKSSKDIQSLLAAKVIVVNPVGSKEAKKATKVIAEVKQETAFIKEVENDATPENIFVAQPAEEPVVEKQKSEVKAEELKVEEVKTAETKEVKAKTVANTDKAKKSDKTETKKSNNNKSKK